jgi:hypothetical protein
MNNARCSLAALAGGITSAAASAPATSAALSIPVGLRFIFYGPFPVLEATFRTNGFNRR